VKSAIGGVIVSRNEISIINIKHIGNNNVAFSKCAALSNGGGVGEMAKRQKISTAAMLSARRAASRMSAVAAAWRHQRNIGNGIVIRQRSGASARMTP
jgi:hypothetical protein